MTVEEIAALRVSDVAAEGAHLYLWTINRYVDDAFDIARAWGFKFSTLLTWAKNPMGGGLGGAYGISTEFCLFCRRGKLATLRDIGTTWFNWKRPYDERGKPRHSAKPMEFIAMVEQVSPGPYLEMFARDRRLGWDAWGNEVPSVELALNASPTDIHGEG
jgi:N6-adenosine-specific RNA methylase IME4